jgi:hypothetical protein
LALAAETNADAAVSKITNGRKGDFMTKTEERLLQLLSGKPKLLMVRHEHSSLCTEFYIMTIGADGKAAEILATGSFEGFDVEIMAALLGRIERCVGKCKSKRMSNAESYEMMEKWERRDD